MGRRESLITTRAPILAAFALAIVVFQGTAISLAQQLMGSVPPDARPVKVDTGSTGRHIRVGRAIQAEANASSDEVSEVTTKANVTEIGSSNFRTADSNSTSAPVRVAFIGTSFMYFNDLPRFMESLSGNVIQQNSCLRGGGTFKSIFQDGNNMYFKFNTANALQADGYDFGAPDVQSLLLPDGNTNQWDYVILVDRSQNPARQETRNESIDWLVKSYAPLIKESGATPIFYVSWAYTRQGGNYSDPVDLGNVTEFTNKVYDGYKAYANALSGVLPSYQEPILAPVGRAFYTVYQENLDLWKRLFHTDNFHPSPLGTYLVGCVLYKTIFGKMPPQESPQGGPATLWEHARVMQPFGEDALPRPTVTEAAYLRRVADRVTPSRIFTRRKGDDE